MHWEEKIIQLIRQTSKWGIHSSAAQLLVECTQLLSNLTQADASFLIRVVDDSTAKVEISLNSTLNELVIDPQPIKELLSKCSDNIISWQQIPLNEKYELHEMLDGVSSAILICLEDSGNDALLLYCWKTPQQFDDAFNQFAEIAKLRMNEMLWQSNTKLSLENVYARFNAILHTVPESVVFIDNGGQKGWINPQAAKLLHLPKSGGQHPTILSAAMAKLRNNTLNSGEINKEAAKLFGTNGGAIKDWIWHLGEPEKHILNVSCTPIISNSLKGMLWVFEDVTSLYLANERLKQVNERLEQETLRADKENNAKSEFLANMSHEIRTPMNGVIGMTSLLMHTALTDEQKEFVETIRISGETLIILINDILDFSKIESGNLELENRPLSVRAVVEETFDLLWLSANKKHLELFYFIEPDVPDNILGDITRLRQILVNLVSNGIKFTDVGQVYVYIRTIENDGDNIKLEFLVEDSGIGIPADKFDKLFHNFSQVDSSTSRKYGGTGLGLAICKKLVNLMKGDIWIESEEKKGSNFYFTITTQVCKECAAQSDILPIVIKPGNKRVIIVDDNAINLTILKKQFEYWGIQADTMQNVHEAITAMQRNHYDLALLDMIMPVLDGLQMAQHLKSNERTKHIPLMLISSAYSSLSLTDEERSLFISVLGKPLKNSHLHKIINKVLGTETQKVEAKVQVIPVVAQSKTSIGILVAEDNVFNQMVVKAMLANFGYHVDTVANGVEAVEAALRQPYQLIFMDMQMPEMDGPEASIRIMAEVTPQPIIIAMTANNTIEDKELCKRAGMVDYIQKPFTLEDIKAVLDKWETAISC